jgi:inward rectifier potassium channel
MVQRPKTDTPEEATPFGQPSEAGFRRSMRPSGRLEVERIGMQRSPLTDMYHFMYTATWRRLLGSFVALWVGLNALFAMAYLAGGNCIEGAEAGSFKDAFNFSVQTMATIGYGGMSPRTDWAHFLVTAEAVTGVLVTAMITGIVFAKFARPTARVLFTNKMLMGTFDGKPCLSFRVANARDSQLVEAHMSVTISIDEPTKEGQPFRRLYDLKLRRDTSPIFAVSWSVIHFIDETSPLYGLSREDFERQQVTFITAMRGTDEVLVQNVYARHNYGWYDVFWGEAFVDVISRTPDGGLQLDYTKFNDTVPDVS